MHKVFFLHLRSKVLTSTVNDKIFKVQRVSWIEVITETIHWRVWTPTTDVLYEAKVWPY